MKRWFIVLLCFNLLMPLSACGFSDSSSVSDTHSDTYIGYLLPEFYQGADGYAKFLSSYSKFLPENFIRYERFSEIGQFESLYFHTPLFYAGDRYSYDYSLLDAGGDAIGVSVLVYPSDYGGANEGFSIFTRRLDAPPTETVPLYCEEYKDYWVIFEGNDNIAYRYDKTTGYLKSMQAFVSNDVCISIYSSEKNLSDTEAFKEENFISNLYKGDYEGFLAFFSDTE